MNQATTLSALAKLSPFLHPSPVLIVISGPSGVGKDSVVRRMKELTDPFYFVITATDRVCRNDEVDGVDYYFVSTAEFEQMIERGDFIEYAVVYDQYKGIPKTHAQQALASGQDVVMRLDVQGTETIRRLIPQAITIFIAPPSVEVLEQRIRRRAGDSPEQMAQRLDNALAELDRLSEFDYVVINHEDSLDQTVQKINAIIATEKCRVGRPIVTL